MAWGEGVKQIIPFGVIGVKGGWLIMRDQVNSMPGTEKRLSAEANAKSCAYLCG